MALIPTRREMKKFSDQHPWLTMFSLVMVGWTAIDVMQSFTLPKGSGPFSGLGSARKHYHPFSDPVQEHWGKYPGGEAVGSEGYTHSHLGATTSTSTTTSSSHPPIVREAMQEEADRRYQNGLFGLTRSGPVSFQTPPALRRRLAAGSSSENGVTGDHLGKQTISIEDASQQNASAQVDGMFGMAGLAPEMGGAWTE